jgi:hypothetical protein
MLGILVLFGVVKKNAILVIDHINQLRAEGSGRGILHGNRDRCPHPRLPSRSWPVLLPTLRPESATSSTAPPPARSSAASCHLLLTLLATLVAYSCDDARSSPAPARLKPRPDSRPAPTR